MPAIRGYNSPARDGDDAVVRDDSYAQVAWRHCVKQMGVLDMATVRYAVRVRGRTCDVAMAAAQEGLDVVIVPARTVLRGRLPDQAALFGVLSRIRLLGLELIEVRRQPQADRR
jgi:hypothetical protein